MCLGRAVCDQEVWDQREKEADVKKKIKTEIRAV